MLTSILLLLVVLVAVLAPVIYLGHEKWNEYNEDSKKRSSREMRQERELREHEERMVRMDSSLSEAQKKALDDIKQRTLLNEKIERNRVRIERQERRASLREAAYAMRLQTQSVHLQPGGGDKDGTLDIRMGSAPTPERPEVGTGTQLRGSAAALHVTDRDMTEYAPMVAGAIWSAEGEIRLGGGNARLVTVPSSLDGQTQIEAHDRLYAPVISTDVLEMGDPEGMASLPGARSALNPNGWRTYFGKAGKEGKNFIRGDTVLQGNVVAKGDLDVKRRLDVSEGSAVFRGADARWGEPVTEEDRSGSRGWETAFPSESEGGKYNRVAGDTRVLGDIEARGEVSATSRSGSNGSDADADAVTAKAKVGLEAGFDRGRRSALNFNGDSGGVSPDAERARWRMFTDVGKGGVESLKIDRTYAPGHADNDGTEDRTWVPVSIEDGRIRLHGKVTICDEDGGNCRDL